MAGIMFIEWACLLPSKNTPEIFISSRSKCLGSFCCQVQAVKACAWNTWGVGASTQQGHRSIGVGKGLSAVGLPATVLVQLPVSHLI